MSKYSRSLRSGRGTKVEARLSSRAQRELERIGRLLGATVDRIYDPGKLVDLEIGDRAAVRSLDLDFEYA